MKRGWLYFWRIMNEPWQVLVGFYAALFVFRILSEGTIALVKSFWK
jgi:hypothetical protein